MKITVPFEERIIPKRYSKYTDELAQGNVIVSFPFSIEGAPAGTKTFAWSLVDYDSIPVCGFAYIHWVVANVPAAKTKIEADFSRIDSQHLHGKNSLVSKFLPTDFSAIEDSYIGPYPPDQDHIYTLTVYALDSDLALSQGFYLNNLQKALEPHLLGRAKIDLIGKY